MGNIWDANTPSPSERGKNHFPDKEKRQNADKIPPKRPPPRAPTTEGLIHHIDARLTGYKDTIRAMKDKNSPETEQQLLEMMSETERDLHKLNQDLKQKQQKEGNSMFYRHLEENEKQKEKENENTLQAVLSANDKLSKENHELKAKFSKENNSLNEELRTERKRIEELNTQNQELLLRLSKVAGDRLVENNPAITDLNDKNRPTKLGEIHSELYDNEWTDAIEALKDQQYEEDFAIRTLYLTLVDVFEFCKRKSESLLTNTEDAVNFLFEEYDLLQKQENKPQYMTKSTGRDKPRHLTIPAGRVTSKDLPNCLHLQQRWISKLKTDDSQKRFTMKVEKSDVVASKVKKLQKEIAESMAQVVQKAYLKSRWIDGQFVPELKPFIRKCIFLCWLMVVQSPPMGFHMVDVNNDAKFDTNLYKAYTANGSMIKFVVWPALLLHEDGPVVGKGVAQGCNCS